MGEMGDLAYVPGNGRRSHGRGADRRRGPGALLQTVVSSFSVARDPSGLRDRFEQDLRTMVRARRVEVCEGSSSKESDPHVMSFAVPSVTMTAGARIEVAFEPGRTLDGWTCQILEAPESSERLVPDVTSALRQASRDGEIRLTYGELTALIADAVKTIRDS